MACRAGNTGADLDRAWDLPANHRPRSNGDRGRHRHRAAVGGLRTGSEATLEEGVVLSVQAWVLIGGNRRFPPARGGADRRGRPQGPDPKRAERKVGTVSPVERPRSTSTSTPTSSGRIVTPSGRRSASARRSTTPATAGSGWSAVTTRWWRCRATGPRSPQVRGGLARRDRVHRHHGRPPDARCAVSENRRGGGPTHVALRRS